MANDKLYPPFNLDIPRMGYLILYKRLPKDKKFGKVIETKQLVAGFLQEDACFIHVEISGGGPDSVSIMMPIAKRIKITEAHAGKEIRIMRYRDEEYKHKRYKVAWFAASLNNSPYDLKGILSFIFRWFKQSNRLWFCSEGALWALQKEFPFALGAMLPGECMPAHFFNPKYFEEVWRGRIPERKRNRR